MNRRNTHRFVGVVTSGLGALVSIWALSNAVPYDLQLAEAEGRVDAIFSNPAWVAGVSLIVVTGALWTATRSTVSNGAVMALAGVVGSGVLTIPSFVDTPTLVGFVLASVGAGLILGGTVLVCEDRTTTLVGYSARAAHYRSGTQ